MKIALYTYRSFRHYGGREIKTTRHLCEAEFLRVQEDGTKLMRLLVACANFPAGHLISVIEKDFDVKN